METSTPRSRLMLPPIDLGRKMIRQRLAHRSKAQISQQLDLQTSRSIKMPTSRKLSRRLLDAVKLHRLDQKGPVRTIVSSLAGAS